MGGGKSSQQMEVVDYNMSIHYGLCHGPVDALLSVIVGEKSAWDGEATTQSIINITKRDLFGGPKKEGGVAGGVYFLPGGPTQVLSADLAARFGRTPSNMPAYRSIASAFFVGGSNSRGDYFGLSELVIDILGLTPGGFYTGGFLWGTNNPYLKGTWFKLRRSPKALATDLRMIGADANPAAVIYECLINREWGMGGAPSTIDTAAFSAAAQTLKDENFGLSLQWTKQSTIESFVSEILDHIQATLFVNPRTGLTTIKLVRNDYIVATLPTLTPDNCKITAFERVGWGETTNEIVVTWTNPENEQEETVAAQNLANITIQGAVISDSRNYYGVRSADLAMRLAKRDLATVSTPLATFEIEVDRSAWDFVPGGCARLYYPEYGIDGVVLRIMKIDYGKPGEPTIRVSAAEDIFSNPATAYDAPSETGWVDPSEDPEPLEYVRIITAPTFFLSRLTAAGDTTSAAYPEVLAAVLASAAGSDTAYYELVGQTVQANGDITLGLKGTKSLVGHAPLPSPLAAEATTLLPTFGPVSGGTGPRVAGFAFIGNIVEGGQEIALIESADETGWTLKRGALDTTPRAWPIGTSVWFINSDSSFIDTGQIHSAGQDVDYKMLSITSRGTLLIADAPVVGAKMTARPWLPNRPANVQVAGAAFGTVDVSVSAPPTLAITWSNRNRLLEDSQVLGWTEPGIPVEDGQTTTVTVYGTDGSVITTHDGITGELFYLPIESFAGLPRADVRVTSKRAGLESLQGHTIRVKVRDGGYGDNYGYGYGAGFSITPGDPGLGDPGDEYIPDEDKPFPSYPWYY